MRGVIDTLRRFSKPTDSHSLRSSRLSSSCNPLNSSIGAKNVMAITGICLVLFVLVHMAGNLQVFAGPDKLNAYAKGLRDLGPLLWVARIGLLALFGLHIAAALRVNARNKAARPTPYLTAQPQVTSYAARTMFMTGLVIAAFALYHLAHFTWGWVQSANHGLLDDKGRTDVYTMVVKGFQNPIVTLTYVIAQVLLALHISHGASSAFQTLGVTNPRLKFLKAGLGKVVGGIVLLGNLSMPISILLGIITLPTGAR